MEKTKSRILKYAIIPAFILCFIFLVGCSTATNNTLNTISLNMNTIINSINQIETIETSSLIIEDFMSENELRELSNDNSWTTYDTTDTMTMYISKLTLLNNAIYNSACVNDNITNYKRQIIAKAHQVKSLCDQCKDEKNTISNQNLDTLEELNNTVMSNSNRASLSRNEVKNNLMQINKIKNEYSSKPEQLSSRYQNLESSLNTRLSYFVNILNSLDNMSYIISSNCNCYDCETLEETENNQIIETSKSDSVYENNKIIETSKPDGVYEHNKMFRKNIDTYENAGKDIYGFNKMYNNRYNDYYLNNNAYNYGYSNIPNFYGNGYRMGVGTPYGMYGFGMGMPFGFGGYGGYTFPNINTYGAYKNIDTYKPRPMPKPYIPEDNVIEDNSESEEISETALNLNDANFSEPKPLPELWNGEKLPNPKPFIYEPESILPSQDLVKSHYSSDKLENEVETSKTNNDDGEDKFVKFNPNHILEDNKKPKIERLEENA
ncbi:MAG: hypothetical protein IJW25_00890 [Clostridia bacterium]|nr:hypothetical protein [Clostridia bacterium]